METNSTILCCEMYYKVIQKSFILKLYQWIQKDFFKYSTAPRVKTKRTFRTSDYLLSTPSYVLSRNIYLERKLGIILINYNVFYY